MSTATATYKRRNRMNGRVYESAQDPTSQQGFNRYAYCFYNPLKYVDPTGERASGPDFRMMAAMIERMIREQCYNKWRDFLMGMGCISMIDINGSWGEFNWCKGGSGSGNSGGGSSIAPKNENGEMIADTSGPMTGDGDPTHTKRDGKTPETAMDAENLFAICYMNYLYGDKQPIYVDASSMSEMLNGLNIGDFTDMGNGLYSINLFDYYSECPDLALALGNIALNSVGDDMYKIMTDEYDFNIPSFNDLIKGEWSKRDFATFLGGLVHGTVGNNYFPIAIPNPGGFFNVSFVVPTGPFYIFFEGYIHINPKP